MALNIAEMDPLLPCAVGISATVLGLVGALAGDWAIARRLGPWLAALAAAVAGVAAALQFPPAWWAPPLCLAGVYGLFRLIRSPWPGRAAALAWTVLQRPRFQWVGLLAVGPLVLGGWAYLALGPVEEFREDEATRFLSEGLPLVQNEQVVARTDRDRTVPLYHIDQASAPDWAAMPDEATFLHERLPLRLIRTAPPTQDYNCHGWVFAGGRFWLKGVDVPTILEDNGYTPVERPQEGDVAIYHGVEGKVTHSALVRGMPGGVLLLESKWGQLGRYYHSPDDQFYGCNPVYYRSPRPDHLLHGLERTPALQNGERTARRPL